MTFLKWLLSFFVKSPYFTGVLKDNRTAAQIGQDYLHEELVTTTVAVDPFSNPQITVSPYPYQNQFGTSSCVTHAVGMAYAIERGLTNFAALAYIFVYRLRSNFAGEGSIPANIFSIYHNTGAPLYTTLPTPQTEVQANNISLTQQMYNEADIYKGAKYFKITTGYNDINTIAQILQQGHAVVVCIFATYDEYSKQIPTVDNPNLKQSDVAAEVQHEICILPNSGFVMNGIKYVAVQDSAWFGGWKLRYFSEGFIKARVTESRYWVGTQVLGNGPIPKYVFTQTLKLGDKNAEVKIMQQLLISEGLLPPDCATGLFGGLTLAGVNAFQQKYAADILLPQGLIAPTGFWGVGCIKKGNALCV